MAQNETHEMSLIERLEAATEGSRELDAEIACYMSGDPLAFVEQSPFNAAWCVYKPCDRRGKRLLENVKVLPFTTSIDAALTLVPKRWGWSLRRFYRMAGAVIELSPQGFMLDGIEARGTTPALAICIAALKALEQDR